MYSYIGESVLNDHLGSSNEPRYNESCYKEVEVYVLKPRAGVPLFLLIIS